MFVVDSLTTNVTSSVNSTGEYVVSYIDNHLAFRYDYVLIYVALKVIQGGGAGTSGLLSNLRSYLWISVSQYTTREVQVIYDLMTYLMENSENVLTSKHHFTDEFLWSFAQPESPMAPPEKNWGGLASHGQRN